MRLRHSLEIIARSGEASFLGVDRMLAAEYARLISAAAGEIVHAVKVYHIELFHFPSRCPGQEQCMVAEVAEARLDALISKGEWQYNLACNLLASRSP